MSDIVSEHIRSRMLERYGRVVSEQDITHMENQIHAGMATSVAELPKQRQIWIVLLDDQPVRVMTRGSRRRILTALPLEVDAWEHRREKKDPAASGA